ncbi:ABC transporter ATP-binding protein [bacterium]|nr:ABC transporter ATP-binding protein [bacterium]
MPNNIIEARGLVKTYNHHRRIVEVLQGVNLSLSVGESAAITGPSGSGKSTLLYLLGLLEPLTDGTLFFNGEDVNSLSDRDRSLIRLSRIGFIFQFHHLLPELTSLENVMLPGLIAGKQMKTCKVRANQLLDQVGLGNRTQHKPGELSGGEQQRTAFARAMMNSPDLLLADEPTGNLDSEASTNLQDLLKKTCQNQQTALLIVTHNVKLAHSAERVFQLTNGLLRPA